MGNEPRPGAGEPPANPTLPEAPASDPNKPRTDRKAVRQAVIPTTTHGPHGPTFPATTAAPERSSTAESAEALAVARSTRPLTQHGFQPPKSPHLPKDSEASKPP